MAVPSTAPRLLLSTPSLPLLVALLVALTATFASMRRYVVACSPEDGSVVTITVPKLLSLCATLNDKKTCAICNGNHPRMSGQLSCSGWLTSLFVTGLETVYFTPIPQACHGFTKRMAEDMQLRNLSPRTIDAYTYHFDRFAMRLRKTP